MASKGVSVRFCIVPGRVKSTTDGDVHQVGVVALARLYGCPPGSWQAHDRLRPCKDKTHLYVRRNGDYQPVDPR